MRRSSVVLVLLSALGGLALAQTAGAAAVVNVSSGNFWFEDASTGDGQIVINAGDQLRVEVVEGTQHTVDIDEFGIASGKMDSGAVFVTPPLNTPGTYTLFCRTHLNRGHSTTLVVVGAATTTTTTTTPSTTTTTAPTTTTTAATTTTTAATTTTDPTGSSTTSATAVAPTTDDGATTTSTDPNTGDATTTTTTLPASSEGGGSDTSVEMGADAVQTAEPIPAGMVEPEGSPLWLRSVWVGLLAMIPLAAGVVAAIIRLER